VAYVRTVGLRTELGLTAISPPTRCIRWAPSSQCVRNPIRAAGDRGGCHQFSIETWQAPGRVATCSENAAIAALRCLLCNDWYGPHRLRKAAMFIALIIPADATQRGIMVWTVVAAGGAAAAVGLYKRYLEERFV